MTVHRKIVSNKNFFHKMEDIEQHLLLLSLLNKLHNVCTLVSGVGGSAAGRCGGGTQRRAASCVSRLTGAPVSDRLCETLPPPVTVQRCEVGYFRIWVKLFFVGLFTPS